MVGYGKRQAKEALNHLFGKTPDTTPAGIIFVSLHTADPGEDGQTANEATGTGYARVATAAADWNAATDADPSVTDNANIIAFAQAGGDWSGGANFTHFGLWATLAGAGEADFVGAGTLNTAKPVLNGDTASFPVGDLDFTLD